MTRLWTKRRRLGDADRDPVYLVAAEWFVRLREPDVSLEETLAWQAWMREDRRNAKAFSRIEEVSTVLRSVPRPDRPLATDAERDYYDASVPIRDWRPQRRPARLVAIAASILLAGVGLALLVVYGGLLPELGAPENVFETRVGENHTVGLSDGSKITLGGNTKIEVSVGDRVRRIELIRGEAFFAVARDPMRPFKVHAGNATVVAIGTEFDVRRGADRVLVAVVEGRVVVEPRRLFVPLPLLREFKPKLVPVQVSAGEETTAGSAGIESAVHVTDMASVTGWRSGRLAFRMQPLRSVLEDVNRYTSKPIVIGDEGIGDLLVTGTVVGNNVSGWLASLESVLGIEALEEQDRVVLRQSK